MIYTRPSICQSLRFLFLLQVHQGPPPKFLSLFSMETTTNHSMLLMKMVMWWYGEEAQRWGWFSQQTSSGHKESDTNEEGRQDGGQAVPEIWDYVEQDNK